MANIIEHLKKILSARKGEEVRGSIHDSIKAMNDQIENDLGGMIEDGNEVIQDMRDEIQSVETMKENGELNMKPEDLTEAQWANLKTDLINYYKRYESIYTTAQENEINIPINISQYNTLSILEVYIEGRMLNREEYTINGTNSITLNIPLSEIGTKVHFIVYRSVCASNEDLNKLKGPKGDSGAIVFNTVAEMKADEDLVAGDTCQLLTNDGEVELYKIINDDFSEYVDDYNYVELKENELYAVRIEQKRDADIKILQSKLNIHSIKENLMEMPLLVIKKLLQGTAGDNMSAQGMCATYNDDDTLKNIYLWGDYGTYSRLYIVTCGSTKTGEGWSYRYTDNVPNCHGSCLSYKDGYILIGELPRNSGLSKGFSKYDIANDSYEVVSLSNVINEGISGVVWDNETKTYLICADINNHMYILDENYNLIHSYHHQTQNFDKYVMQGYDYKYGHEFRTVSTSLGNFIFVFDTISGNLLKICSLGMNGEVEDISINNGFAILYYNGFNPGYDQINMNAVTQCYIGGSPTNDAFLGLQQDIMNVPQLLNSFGGHILQYADVPIYFENNYSNNDLIRYCGVGTVENPFKSGLALSTFICSWAKVASTFSLKINILSSSNTDDNGIRIMEQHGIDHIEIQGNSNPLCDLHIVGGKLNIRNINIVSGDSRRSTGKLTLLKQQSLEFGNTNLCEYFDIEYCSGMILFDNGISATDSTKQSIMRRNIIVNNPNKVSATNLNKYDNLLPSG